MADCTTFALVFIHPCSQNVKDKVALDTDLLICLNFILKNAWEIYRTGRRVRGKIYTCLGALVADDPEIPDELGWSQTEAADDVECKITIVERVWGPK